MAFKKPRVLIVDDDRSFCEILKNTLEYEEYIVGTANDGKAALSRLNEKPFDIVLLDLNLPDIPGIKILQKARKMEPPVQVVMISGEGTIHTAVEATKKGAYDFLEKPVDTDRLLLTVKNALDRGRLEMEKVQLLDRVKQHYVMIGSSPKMMEIHELIQKAGATNSKVLIEGENGTGKELVARAIHHESSRAGQSFVAVNCAAIPDTLIESELFGHKKGSFTGAVADKAGKFQTADGGTLFLDEIGDMSLMTQAKVLRALEENVVEMVGSGESIPVDVRVIAATNKNLQKEMQDGNFREDLFFRLNVLNIKVPPLRERKEDIPQLVEYYVQFFCAEHGIKLKKIAPKAMQSLLRHNWPGNVRELRNFVEKLVILITPSEIQSEHIGSILGQHTPSKPAAAEDLFLKEARESFERDFIRQKLAAYDWNVTKAAKVLGVPRTYLYKKMHKLGVEI
jgi:two-component system nitrogen regulation response regulator NtrX